MKKDQIQFLELTAGSNTNISVERFSSKFYMAEERISRVEKTVGMQHRETKVENTKKNETLRIQWRPNRFF